MCHLHKTLIALWRSTLVLALCAITSQVVAADLSAKMLANGTALIEINGKQRMLRAGQTSPEGVTLVSSSRAGAEVEFQGQTYNLTLERRIATSFEEAASAEVRISSGQGGHYETKGYINGMPADFLVDTGATSVSMSGQHAEELGLNYLSGNPLQVSTANGVTTAYGIWLDSVAVGLIEIKHVEAVVIPGNSPRTILLGNSYLGLVDMSTENGVLVLKSRL
ncbi:TIGR02281 family clan AA aspartic protease [Gilvimarinus sp. SDUM040013]|uniref:TIGR02281 family clan AA aspartic protease n=1 Tax=Gilvimarinus gilvus TaxID=3058038 RepID=A0ABU4S308_9GAMM|nr:TIGR02281 family clan AA aspartic protease [Gilvimarinus sp. SDUM040013]MDO3387218.1 TIGR02281 family clan AA aspartic protease [Gilvimarinus sp. SDUM040013]MDX6850781.1 TIGR02281 family clan AA aspartic protease [Gilvimarinus sp. SDUM040013]